VDNFTNPTANDSLNLPSHSTQHANANDAIEAIETYLLNGGQGLTLVKKQTIGTGVSTVTVTGAFSATYENYKIIISGGASSAGAGLSLALGATATGYYSGGAYSAYAGGSPSNLSGNNAVRWNFAGGYTQTTGLFMDLELISPFTAHSTKYTGPYLDASGGGTSAGYLNNTTSYTDFTIAPATGTITGGTIYVYGYGIGT